MTSAAIAGNYAEFKLVKTRGVFAITIEFAVERTAEVFAALGYPMPGTEIPVAVARLRKEVMPVGDRIQSTTDTPPSSQTLEAGAADAAMWQEEMDSADEEAWQAGAYSHVSGQGSSGGSTLGSPVAPEGDENRGACPTCHGEKRILYVYDRPGGPPGNQWIDCPDCAGPRAVKRAGILCKDPEFQDWVAAPIITADGTLGDQEEVAAQFVRTRCYIASRRDLAHDARARERFEALCTEFDIWRGRIAEVRG